MIETRYEMEFAMMRWYDLAFFEHLRSFLRRFPPHFHYFILSMLTIYRLNDFSLPYHIHAFTDL